MAQKAWKKHAYDQALNDIIELEDMGYRVRRMTDWHWRINDQIDVWPSALKFKYGGQILTYNKIRDLINYL